MRSASYCNPSRRPGETRDNEFNAVPTIAGRDLVHEQRTTQPRNHFPARWRARQFEAATGVEAEKFLNRLRYENSP